MIDEIIPALSSEDASLVVPEIPGLVEELRGEDRYDKLQASGILSVLSNSRPDSETVLVAAFPALENHMHDADANIRNNCVLALAGLMPSIPPEVLDVLAKVLQANQSDLTLPAMRGVLRLYGADPTATNAINDYLNGDEQKKSTLLKSIGVGSHDRPALIAQLGRLLNDPSAKIVDATLEAIGNNGAPAIQLLKPQLTDFEDRTRNPVLARKAHELLRALEPPADDN